MWVTSMQLITTPARCALLIDVREMGCCGWGGCVELCCLGVRVWGKSDCGEEVSSEAQRLPLRPSLVFRFTPRLRAMAVPVPVRVTPTLLKTFPYHPD